MASSRFSISTPNAQRIIANSIHAAVFLHKSLDTRDNAWRLSSFLWGLKQPWAGTRTKHSANSGNSARRCLVCFVSQVTFSLNSQSLVSETSCDDCVLRRGSATCVDSFLRFPGFTLRFEATASRFRCEGSGLNREQIGIVRDRPQMPTRHRQKLVLGDLHVTPLDSLHSPIWRSNSQLMKPKVNSACSFCFHSSRGCYSSRYAIQFYANSCCCKNK